MTVSSRVGSEGPSRTSLPEWRAVAAHAAASDRVHLRDLFAADPGRYAARVTIAEVEEIVEPGALDPDQIHTSGIYVHRVIQGVNYEKRIERRTVREG